MFLTHMCLSGNGVFTGCPRMQNSKNQVLILKDLRHKNLQKYLFSDNLFILELRISLRTLRRCVRDFVHHRGTEGTEKNIMQNSEFRVQCEGFCFTQSRPNGIVDSTGQAKGAKDKSIL